MKKLLYIIVALLIVLIAAYFGYYFFIMRDVKTPQYTLNEKQENIEVRTYPPLLIAEVTVQGTRREAINQGFRVLAKYIFGENIKMTAPVIQQESETIKMTAPVIQKTISDNEWQIRFIMPSKYTIETLPRPKDARIKIYLQPSQKVVAIRFSGRMTKRNLKHNLEILQKYIQQNNLTTEGDAIYAFYNPPFTLPFMRRNEIMFELSGR